MRARCPHCATVFNTDRGGVQFCPSCGKQINVPAPGAAGGSPAPESAPSGSSPTEPSSGEGSSGAQGAGSYGGFGSGGSLPPPPPPPPPYGGGNYSYQAPQGSTYGTPGVEAPTPWEDRARVGFLRGFFGTLKESVFSPQRFWPTVDPHGNWVSAMTYGWLAQSIGLIVGAPLTFLQMRMSTAGQPAEVSELFDKITDPAIFAAYIIGSVLLYPVMFVISTGITHLLCMLFGAGGNGFGATARGVGYAAGPLLLSGIPCINGLAGLYYFVLMIWGISATQRVEWWRPLLAVLAPLILVCCCGGVAIMVAAAGASGAGI